MDIGYDNQARLTAELTRQKEREIARLKEEYKGKLLKKVKVKKEKSEFKTLNKILNKKLVYKPIVKSQQVKVHIEEPQQAFEHSRFFKMPSTTEERMKWL